MKRQHIISAVVCLFVFAALTQAQSAFVTMKETSGAYTVEGHFSVDTPTSIAWNVLTDYDHISDFVSSMERSHIREKTGDTLLVEQTASGQFFVFSRSATVLLNILEKPDQSIQFEDVSHKDFDYYRGLWKIEKLKNGLVVDYQLQMKSRFAVPQFIQRHSVRKGIAQLLEQVRSEMLKRSAARHSP